ncbi:MAG TPA: hypothetical protein VFW03_11810 [Gemmatimonadaceae bacterium]|nr:hypothetical protein [Gemmatimonadaceae bacterium]
MLRIPSSLCLLGLALIVQAPGSSRLTPNVVVACDSLKTRESDPLRYRQRGDRCEGVYAQEVSGSSDLLVASLVESFETIDDTSSLPLRVEWTPPDGEAVRLRAYSIKPGLFYRMDTATPIAASSYLWPADVLQALRISNADIGVTGSASAMLGGERRDVLVPLRIGRHKPPARSTRYRLALWSNVELNDVFITLATTGSDGKPVKYLQRDENLAYGFYPAERAIDITLEPLAARGFYYVRIGATRKRGGSLTSEFFLFHPGSPSARGNQ